MAGSSRKSHLYPTVFRNGDKRQPNEPFNEAQVDLLNPQDTLAQDVSSTAVLTPIVEDDLVGNPQDFDGPDRGNWSGRFDFLMSLLGYSVGLGNVWRFPYLAYSNGGGAFLFPFIIMLLLIGLPLMFMELAFGQFAALGPAAIFDRICPLFYGIGYGMVAVTSMVALYYTVLIGWAFLYLFKSFTSELPWERCHSEWRTEKCYSYKEAEACLSVNTSVFYNHICYNQTEAELLNYTNLLHNKSLRSAPSQDYFEKELLKMSNGIEEIGSVQWQVALCLLLAWALTFLALSKGVKSVGKVVYFTALFPYVVLTILFFRGITLPGAKDGIIYYLTPDFSQLIKAQTWVAAAVQIFFALSPAWGGLITLSSYNKFHNNCFKDALIVGIGNVATSIFAGFVIFAIVGYLAKELDVPVDKVVDEGPGLAFIVFPDVVTRLPVSPLWSILFFVMLITLGMGSEFALLETIMTAVQDTFPHLRQKKVWVVLSVSILGFLGGLPVCTQGGMYILTLMDTYSASWSVFVMAILECVILAWIYGADRFLDNIEMMIGRKTTAWRMVFKIFWKYLSPATLVFLLIFNWVQYKRLTYAGKLFPLWADMIGWLMASIPIIAILSMSVLRFVRTPGDKSVILKLKSLLKATPKWGPSATMVRIEIIEPESGKTVTNPGFAGSTSTYLGSSVV